MLFTQPGIRYLVSSGTEDNFAFTAMGNPGRFVTMIDAVELAPLSRNRSVYTTPPRIATKDPSANPSLASTTAWFSPRFTRAVLLSRNTAVHFAPRIAVVLASKSAEHGYTPPSVSPAVSPRSVSVSNFTSIIALEFTKCAHISIEGGSLKSSGLQYSKDPSCAGPLMSAAYASVLRQSLPSNSSHPVPHFAFSPQTCNAFADV